MRVGWIARVVNRPSVLISVRHFTPWGRVEVGVTEPQTRPAHTRASRLDLTLLHPPSLSDNKTAQQTCPSTPNTTSQASFMPPSWRLAG